MGNTQAAAVTQTQQQENANKSRLKARHRGGGGRYDGASAVVGSDSGQRRFAPGKDDGLVIDVCELWLRPLAQAVAAAFGGKHSFIVLRLQDKTYRLAEKHADGICEVRVLPRSEYISYTTKMKKVGWEKRRTASRLQGNSSKKASLRKGIKLGELRIITESHDGVYDVHNANCHAYSKDLWNACVMARKGVAQKEQHSLSRMAAAIGIGASTRVRVQNQEEGFN